jgi:lysophospholipase L1-like esterase
VRAGGWGLGAYGVTGGTAAPAPPSFAIVSFSPGSGPIAGGTVVTVVATGIVGTPTSTLGAVSGVTSGGFTITTSAHAAGVVSWTATNGNAVVSSPQSFTYTAPAQFDVNNFPNFTSLLAGGVFPTVYNIVLDGDSLTAGPAQAPQGPANWPPELQALLGSQVKLTVVASGGKTLQTMVAQGPAQVDTLISTAPGVCNIVWWQGGINDANAGATTAQIEARYQAYGLARKAAGWNFVICGNVEASNVWTSSAVYSTIAAWMQANAAAFSDAMADFPANPLIGPTGSYADLRYFLDNTHKTINGDELKAREIIYPTFHGVMAPADQAAGHAFFGIYPNHGPIGVVTPVGIRVTNLLPGDVITSVTIGGQVCSAISFVPTLNTVYATVPVGASSGDVAVVINGVAVRGGVGAWTANNVPVLTSVQPSVLLVGTAVPMVIDCDPGGEPFAAGMVPTIQGVACTSVVIVSTTRITCLSPTGLTPEVAGQPLSQVVVAGSPQTAISEIGVLPASFVTAIEVCPANYNVVTGALQDITHAFSLTPQNAPVYVASALNARPGISFVKASSQFLSNNATPAALANPTSEFVVGIVPAWGASNGGIAGGNNTSHGAFLVNGTNTFWWNCGGGASAIEDTAAPSAVGYPGNAFFAIVASTTVGSMYVDGAALPTSIVGALGGGGKGISWGYFGGNYGTCTICLHARANDALSSTERTAAQWIAHRKWGTAYP